MGTMGTKHTPGPWKAEGRESTVVNAENGDTIVVIPGASKNAPLAEHKANAALIAAAPDLLAVAKKLHLSINGLNATMRSTSPAYSRTTLCQELSELIAESAAAIAKAEGGA